MVSTNIQGVREWEFVRENVVENINRDIFIFDGGNKRLRNVTNLYCQCQISQKRNHEISTEMQQLAIRKLFIVELEK
jgi:hypothetical protein